jgi:pimeloyl-ACP methyl ester carboxylesterase
MLYATAPDGARIYYEIAGTGEPLLLISGQAGDHHGWDAVRPDFTDRYRTIVFDHRGTGASDKPDVPYSTRGFARDAVAVLDAAGIERAHAYGTSMGGRIGQWLGIEHADRLGALVLACTTPGDAHGIRRTAEADARLLAVTDADNVAEHLLADFTQGWIDAHPELLVVLDNPLPRHALVRHYRASQRHDSWAELPRIIAPTLVIHGGDDTVNPTANAPLLAGRIPGAELHIVAGGRHSFFIEFRTETTAVVRDFLARHALSRVDAE